MENSAFHSSRFAPGSLIAAAVLIILSPLGVHAGTHVWKGGGGDTLWSNEDNWSYGGAPEDGEDTAVELVFPASAQSHHTTCDISPLAIDAMFVRGTYTFSHTDPEDGEKLHIWAHAADNIVIDVNTSPTVTFDSSFAVGFVGAGRGRIRMMSGTLRILGSFYATVTMDGEGQVFCEGGKYFNASISLSGLTLHLNKSADSAGISYLGADQGAAILVEASNQLRGAEVSLDGVALTMASGATDWIGPLRLAQGANINALNAGAAMHLTGGVTGSDGSNYLLGHFPLGGVTRVFNVVADAGSLTVAGVLEDGMGFIGAQVYQTGGLRKRGPGDLRLTGANTFKGPVIVEEGQIIAEASSVFGTVAGGVTVEPNAGLTLKGAHIGGEHLTLGGRLEVPSGTNSWAGDVVLESTAKPIVVSLVPDPAILTLSGIISGPGTLILEGGGSLELAGAGSNTYGGETVNRTGVMRLNKSSGNAIPGPLTVTAYNGDFETRVTLAADHQIADSATILLNGAIATLDLAGHDEVIGALWSINKVAGAGGGFSGGGQVWLGNSRTGTAVFSVGANHLSTEFTGMITGSDGMTLAKVGTGTLTMGYYGNTNTFSGQTRVQGGTLLVNAPQKVGPVVVKSGATLGGTGTTGAVIMDGGNLCACHLTTGTVTANPSGAHYLADLLGPNPTTGGYDQLAVKGTLNLGNSLLTAALAYSPALNARFVIVKNDGTDAVIGHFLGLAEGSPVTISGRPFTISYVGGDGNDVELRFTGWAGGPPRITSVSYNKQTDTVLLLGIAKPGVLHQWQVSSSLKTWSTFASGIPDSGGTLNLEQPLGLHASELSFRLVQP